MIWRDWERGTIIIPKAKWSQFRLVLIGLYNALLQKDFLEAKELYLQVKSAGAYKRGEAKYQSRQECIAEYCGFELDGWVSSLDKWEKYERFCSMLFCEDEDGEKTKLQLPKKNQLAYLPSNGEKDIQFCGARISFNNKSHFVQWEVQEGPNACEVARSHPIAQEFFRQLERMEWAKGTGGRIIGNDNCNVNPELKTEQKEDYVKVRFGKLI
jgi:hypothetical protein